MSEPLLGGYGFVSADSGAQPVTKDTVFQIASVSKVITGASVMKAIEDGLISSEQEDICEVLPDEYDATACRNPNYANVPVTWAHLMTHTSSLQVGVPDGKKTIFCRCVLVAPAFCLIKLDHLVGRL